MRYIEKKIIWIPLLALLAGILTGCSAEAKKSRHQERADKYFAEGKYSQAEIEYFNVLQLDRTNAHAIGQIGTIYFENGRTVKAIPFLVKASELSPNDTELQVKLGAIHLAGGSVQEARKFADSILKTDATNALGILLLSDLARTPDAIREARARLEQIAAQTGQSAAIHVALGGLLLKEGKIKEAEASMRRAIEADPKFKQAHQMLGMITWAQTNLVTAAEELKLAADLSPPRSLQRTQFAEFLIKTGKIEEGKKLLTEMTKETPDYLPPWVLLADMAFSQKDFEECGRLLKEALSRGSEHYDAMLLNGRLMLATGENDKAYTELERLSTGYPKSPAAQYFMGIACLTRNDAAKAMTHFNEAIKLNPEFDDAILQQAQLNIRRDNIPAAISSLTELIKRRPNQGPAYLVLAAAHISKGDLNEGLATYRRMETIFPTNAQVRLLTGVVLQQQGKPSEARAAFQHALELNPDNLQPVELLVNLDLAEKKYTEAGQRLQQQIAQKPRLPELQVLLANVHFAQQQTNQAEQALLKAIELKPDFQPAHRNLAQLYIASHKHPQALEKLNGLVKSNTNDTSALLQIGVIQSELKKYPEARDAYEKIVAINPRASVAYNNLAYLYSEHLGQLEKGYEAARKARELLPNDPAVADTLGWIAHKRGDYPWALTLLQESAEKLPGEPEVLFHLGLTQYMLGQEDAARSSLSRAAQSTKEFKGQDEIARHIAVLNMDSSNAANNLPTWEKMAADHPDDPILLARLANVYERQNQLEKAVKLYERAVEKNPRNLSVTLRLAQIYSDQLHDAKKAMQMAKAARNLAPEDPQVAHALGRLAYESGDFAWALALLQESERKLPKQPEILFDLALSFFSVGRIADAESAMSGALAADPALSKANAAKQFLGFAAAYQNPSQASASATAVQTTLRTQPQYLPALAVNGMLQEQRGDTAGAKATYEAIQAKYPAFTPSLKRLALLHAAPSGDPQKAYDYAVKARSAFPNDSEVAKTLGILTYGRRDYQRAVQLLKEASSKLPQDGESLFYLGMGQHQLKQKADAEKSLRQSLALNLDPKLAQEANKVLTAPN
jgi:tetratricopeptide (TPR) repeat protein